MTVSAEAVAIAARVCKVCPGTGWIATMSKPQGLEYWRCPCCGGSGARYGGPPTIHVHTFKQRKPKKAKPAATGDRHPLGNAPNTNGSET